MKVDLPDKVRLDDFQILKLLGKGAYGKVYQVRKPSIYLSRLPNGPRLDLPSSLGPQSIWPPPGRDLRDEGHPQGVDCREPNRPASHPGREGRPRPRRPPLCRQTGESLESPLLGSHRFTFYLLLQHYAFETRQRLFFVQEFCNGGELFRRMEVERLMAEDDAR